MYDYYKELYLLLFNRVTDAVRYLEEGSPGQAAGFSRRRRGRRRTSI